MAQRQRDIGADVIHGLVADAPDLDPRYFAIMNGVMGTVLKRAAERGELASADLSPRVVTLPADLLRHEMLLTCQPLAETTLIEIVDDVFLPLIRAKTATPPAS
ncbi:TetR-like C-terminal domain-containing protein [Spirillospora sp. NPDC048911]|uniref:TetR-like C-terminal domain-containing protein n=1 Tax=Spirillospora sp. NPDC048911 TaxID=3364527 RepID=UPI003724A2BF